MEQKSKVKLNFNAPNPGDYKLTLYFMCDSYSGCDQEYDVPLKVKPADKEDNQDKMED